MLMVVLVPLGHNSSVTIGKLKRNYIYDQFVLRFAQMTTSAGSSYCCHLTRLFPSREEREERQMGSTIPNRFVATCSTKCLRRKFITHGPTTCTMQASIQRKFTLPEMGMIINKILLVYIWYMFYFLAQTNAQCAKVAERRRKNHLSCRIATLNQDKWTVLSF